MGNVGFVALLIKLNTKIACNAGDFILSNHGYEASTSSGCGFEVTKKPANALPKINQIVAGQHRVLVVDEE